MTGHRQLDLFASPAPPPWSPDSDSERIGWERRVLADMADGPLTCCFPGFTGAVCERLVAKGLVEREDAGFMGPTIDLDGKPVLYRPATKDAPSYRFVPGEHPQFKYSLKNVTSDERQECDMGGNVAGERG